MKRLIQKYKSTPIQIKASFWFLICAFLQKGVTAVSTPIFTRIMTAAEFGQFNVFNSWLSIITIITSLYLYAGVHAQGLVKFSSDKNAFSSSLQGLTLTLIGAWTLIYFFTRDFWNSLLNLTTNQMLAMFCLIWSTSVFNFWANDQRTSYRYIALVIITFLVSTAKPLVGYFMVVNSDNKVLARILGLMLVELVGYGGLFFVQMAKGRKFFSWQYWKYAILFNLPLIPHYLSQMVLVGADRIMIQHMIGDSEAGIYSLAYSISSIMTLFSAALTQTITPWMYQKIKDKKSADMAPIAYLSLIFIAGVNLLLILFAPEILFVFAPKEYSEAIWIIPPVAMSVFFMFAYDLFAKFAFYHEKTTWIMLASLGGALLNVILNYFFIRLFGYIAAGYTTLACYVVYAVAHFLIMRAVCKKNDEGVGPYKIRVLLLISISFVVSGFLFQLTYFLPDFPYIRYAIFGVGLVMLVIFHKPILKAFRTLLSVRKKQAATSTEESSK